MWCDGGVCIYGNVIEAFLNGYCYSKIMWQRKLIEGTYTLISHVHTKCLLAHELSVYKDESMGCSRGKRFLR